MFWKEIQSAEISRIIFWDVGVFFWAFFIFFLGCFGKAFCRYVTIRSGASYSYFLATSWVRTIVKTCKNYIFHRENSQEFARLPCLAGYAGLISSINTPNFPPRHQGSVPSCWHSSRGITANKSSNNTGSILWDTWASWTKFHQESGPSRFFPKYSTL